MAPANPLSRVTDADVARAVRFVEGVFGTTDGTVFDMAARKGIYLRRNETKEVPS